MLASLQSADPVLYYLGLSSALKLSLSYLARKTTPKEHVGEVAQCIVYPLKSGHGVEADYLECGFSEGPRFGKLADRFVLKEKHSYSVFLALDEMND